MQGLVDSRAGREAQEVVRRPDAHWSGLSHAVTDASLEIKRWPAMGLSGLSGVCMHFSDRFHGAFRVRKIYTIFGQIQCTPLPSQVGRPNRPNRCLALRAPLPLKSLRVNEESANEMAVMLDQMVAGLCQPMLLIA